MNQNSSHSITIRSVRLVLFGTFLFILFRQTVPTIFPFRSPRLVLLYATCSLNKDYLSPYKKNRYTPNLEAFGKESLVFQNQVSESSFSGAAYASLFAGEYMHRHGIYYHPKSLKDESYLIAEAFRDSGYDTFYFNGHVMATAQLNYAQGISQSNIVKWDPTIPETVVLKDKKFHKLLKQLTKKKWRKAFLQMNFSMTHAPYSGNSSLSTTAQFCKEFPEECEGATPEDFSRYIPLYREHHVNLQTKFQKTVESLNLKATDIEKMARVLEITYKSSVRLLDKSFAETIKQIRKAGLLEESLIVFTSDHGEVLYRDSSPIQWSHSCSLNCLEPESLNIPLMIRMPNQFKNGFYSKITRSIDVFPTIAGLCRVRIPDKSRPDGHNLSAAILGQATAPDLVAYSCGELPHPAIYIENPSELDVQARTKDTILRLFHTSYGEYTFRVFHVASGFSVPMLNDQDINHSGLPRKKLQDYAERLTTGYRPPVPDKDWNENLEKLKSLGYVN